MISEWRSVLARFSLTEYSDPAQLRWRLSLLRLDHQWDGWYRLEAASQGRQIQLQPSFVQVRT